MSHEPPRLRVSGILYRGDSLVLVRQEKAGRAYWLLPGGGVEAGETMEHALKRELAEECSLRGLSAAQSLYVTDSQFPDKTQIPEPIDQQSSALARELYALAQGLAAAKE